MKRHFTATGFVVEGDRTLLHWHRRLEQWMPPGGHIEPDEDPVQAVLREIREETGLTAEVIRRTPGSRFEVPAEIAAPYTILIEDIPAHEGEAAHQHIDLIYFCTPVIGATGDAIDPAFRWVDEGELRDEAPLDVGGCGLSVRVPQDVRELALIAIATARRVPSRESRVL